MLFTDSQIMADTERFTVPSLLTSIKKECRVNDIVTAQIGRKARDMLGVALVCRFTLPQIELVHPFLGGAPHPSILWLSCPSLDKAVARLESRGFIYELNTILESDRELKDDLRTQSELFISYRRALAEAALLRTDVNVIHAHGSAPGGSARSDDTAFAEGFDLATFNSGIDGSAELGRVKCLHSHLAAHLAFRNFQLGKLIWDQIPRNYCETPCV